MSELKEHVIKDIYLGVRGAAVKILNRVERTDSYLDKLLDWEIKHSNIESRDKALLFEIVHGVVRWMGRLDWILSGFYKGQFSKAIPHLKNALRVALYQIMFLDKVPDYAIVNEAVEFVKKLQGQKPADITNAVLRNILRTRNAFRYPNPEENLTGYLTAYLSHPSWLAKRWLQRYGRDETMALMEANNERPSLTLRVNLLKTSNNEFKSLLDSVDLKFDGGKYFNDFFRLHNLTDIQYWEYFNKGFFAIQDESTGFAVNLLGVEPGMRVLDLCAAPGGKSAYIAQKLDNKGEIVTIDRFESRLNILEKNFERLGITNYQAVCTDALEYQDEKFDRILADVPCSGLGTLTKKPEIKWKKDLLDVRRLSDLQFRLLEKAGSLIKDDGIIIYSTCTIEPEENFEIVYRFLAENPGFELVDLSREAPEEVVDSNGCIQTMPHKHDMDGAFVAKIRKTG